MQRRTLLEHNGDPLVDIASFGRINGGFDLLLDCPHGESGSEFWNFFPDIRERILETFSQELLNKYLSVEHDFASCCFTEVVAQKIAEAIPALRIGVTRVRYHRGILDANRTENAVRFPALYTKEQQKMLMDIRNKTVKAMEDLCNKDLISGGMFISMHSMWPTCQKEAPSIFEKQGNMQGYVNALVDSGNQEERERGIDVITHKYDGETNEQVTRDLQMSKEILKALKGGTILVHTNHPYPLADEHPICTYVGKPHYGFALDVPRHLLGNAEMRNGFPVWVEDEKKIEMVAEAFARGMVEILRQ